METISMENRRKYKFIGELSMVKTSKVAMESPKNVKKDMAKRKKFNAHKPKKQIAAATDIRYYYPKTWEEMWPHRGFIEYKMSPEMIADVLNDVKKNVDPQKYLCDYVNDQYGLMGYCVRVIAG